MQNITLSIIIPVYNVDQYLKQCLDSILSFNTFNEVEIICVNDGSTDESSAILSTFKKQHPGIIIINKENGGLSDARNFGFDKASGKYVYFLDSDDFLVENSLSIIIKTLSEWDLDIYCFNCIFLNTNRLYFELKYSPVEILTGKEFISTINSKNGFFPPSPVPLYIYKRDFLKAEKLLFFKGIIHEDELFTPQALYLAKRVRFFSVPIFYYRIGREASIMNSESIQNIRDLLFINSQLFKFFCDYNVKDKIYYKHLINNYLIVVNKITILGYLEKRNKLMSNIDYRIINKCITSWDWYLYFYLFRNNLHVFRYFSNNTDPTFFTKCLSYLIRLIKPFQYLRLRFGDNFLK